MVFDGLGKVPHLVSESLGILVKRQAPWVLANGVADGGDGKTSSSTRLRSPPARHERILKISLQQ